MKWLPGPGVDGIDGGHQFCQSLLSLAERSAELESLGVQVKDYAKGLIDFLRCVMAAWCCSAGCWAREIASDGGMKWTPASLAGSLSDPVL
ncbi:MAG: hypothetical protein WKF84_11560 [Pyrinomonadaceae bacterium]